MQRPHSRVACYVALLIYLSTFPLTATAIIGFGFNNAGVGPDGPWNYVELSTDQPEQTIAVYPTLLGVSMLVNKTTCQKQMSQCPPPATMQMWTEESDTDASVNDLKSAVFYTTELSGLNGGYFTTLMGLQGNYHLIPQGYTLRKPVTYVNGSATAVAEDISVTFPNKKTYTLAVGYVSLYGGESFTYDLANGTTSTLKPILYNGYDMGVYQSISYGLHIGSAVHNVYGRMLWGGYDQSPCIGEPITTKSNSSFFSLANISLGVTEGRSAFLKNTSDSGEVAGLLRTNASDDMTLPLPTRADPGVPYMYLPGATCDAIAAHLPVTYSPDFGLYLWNTSAPSFTEIITSPHYLSFHFHTSASTGSPTSPIHIPFALLNLTLTSPIVDTDTAYFPCRPYSSSPADANANAAGAPQHSAILGRAFLQGAHLAQNWQTRRTWLAQGPGPAFAPESMKLIDPDSTTLALPQSAQRPWAETWQSVLTPLSGAAAAAAAASSEKASGMVPPSAGLSPGAKAGIGVGAAAGGIAVVVGAVCWWKRRRRRGATTAQLPDDEVKRLPLEQQELEGAQKQELPARVEELPDGVGRLELPA